MDQQALEAVLAAEQERYIEEWKELLAFPSISSDPAHTRDCERCADWLVDHLRAMGLETQLLPTSGKPVVFAEHRGAPDAPRLLFYGHYDVQPVDPVDLWETPPFEPVLRNGRIYARGAADNKGQFFFFLKALESLLRNGGPRASVSLLLEGEEESGSQGITAALDHWKDRLKSDVLIVADTSMSPSGAASIIMGLRGIIHVNLALTGPDHDLHSGTHGGTAPNPATEMARLLTTLHDAEGRIAVPGFYDAVTMPSTRERALANAVPLDPADYRRQTGVPPTGGESAFTPAERQGFRPAIDINGIHTGYGGMGVKTIIPARAEAKLTARLVPNQDPASCLEAVVRHLHAHTPDSLHLEIDEQSVGGPGFRLPLDSPLTAKAQAILTRITDRETMLVWEGASIPAVANLVLVSGAEPLLVGFGAESDRAHAPNESFSLDQFKLGYLYSALLLAEL